MKNKNIFPFVMILLVGVGLLTWSAWRLSFVDYVLATTGISLVGYAFLRLLLPVLRKDNNSTSSNPPAVMTETKGR